MLRIEIRIIKLKSDAFTHIIVFAETYLSIMLCAMLLLLIITTLTLL
jgi:hypothetical protein